MVEEIFIMKEPTHNYAQVLQIDLVLCKFSMITSLLANSDYVSTIISTPKDKTNLTN